MSSLSAFVTAAAASAFGTIGTVPVVIGALTLDCVLGEAVESKEYGEAGNKVIKRLPATCNAPTVAAAWLIQKAARINGEEWRVAEVSAGASFMTLTFEQTSKV